MTDEQTAAETLDQIIFSETRTDGIAAIVRALQAARKECMDADDVDLVAPTPEVVSTFRTKAPPGHIIDDAGVVLKLSGALPVTADRVVVCYASTPLWHPILGQMDTLEGEPYATWRNGMGKRTSECYSTPEAADAAKEGKA